jgi:hypothetical protein
MPGPRGRQVLIVCAVRLLGHGGRANPEPAEVEPGRPAGAAPAVDRSGDPLPSGARVRLGTVRFRHAGPVTFAGVTTDGKTLISA